MNISRTCRLMLALLVATVCPCLFAQTFTFGPPITVTPNPAGFSFQPTDLNGDGITDLTYYDNRYNLHGLIGDGHGGFAPIAITADQTNFPNPVTGFLDLNGDGIADEYYIYPGFWDDRIPGLQWSGQLVVLLGDGKGNFKESSWVPIPEAGSFAFVTGDFNGDGKIDFAYLSWNDPQGYQDNITVLVNEGNGNFTTGPSTLISRDYSSTLVAGDFNGDGKLDLAELPDLRFTNNTGPFPILYRYGNGDGTFGEARTYYPDTAPISIATGDFNHDGKADLLVGLAAKTDLSGNFVPGSHPRLATLLAKQKGGFYWHSDVPLSMSPAILSVTELNDDGLQDVAIQSYSGNGKSNLALFAGKGGGSFGGPQIQGPGAYQIFLAPLATGELPALFSQVNGNSLTVQLNTSDH